ncbi:efflux RND transporter periplasmic adaptor subunit [bacterium]|nr:efflux RND transporter periplasmic adaptor subunit [bacterium]MBU1994849.1 efflux RND transporter periplasmic adaptor subunit [bacterium]
MRKIFNKKVLAIALFLIIALAAGKFLIAKKAEVANMPTAIKPALSVTLAHAENSHLIEKQNYLANVKADKSINVSSKLSGYIKNIKVSEGDYVKKGALLLTIDDSEIVTNIDSLKSSQTAAQKEFEYKSRVFATNQKLYENKAISKEQLDLSNVSLLTSKASLLSTQKKIDALVSQLEYLHIKAPFEGIVSELITNMGDLAVANKPIIKLNSRDKKLTFSFVDKKIKKGLKVFLNHEEIGEINTIYNDAQNALKVAEVSLSKNIPSVNGENIDIEIMINKIEGCVVDNRAILHDNFETKIVVYNKNRFEFLNVKVLLTQENQSIIFPCVPEKIAIASQTKLSILPQYSEVNIIETDNEIQ